MTHDPARTAPSVPAAPEMPLLALLGVVSRDIGVDRVDRVWLFPPRRLRAGETGLVVVAAFTGDEDDRRRVFAARYTVPADVAEPTLALDEFGLAPLDRVGRAVEDVVERLRDDSPAAPPRVHVVAGDAASWDALLAEVAGTGYR